MLTVIDATVKPPVMNSLYEYYQSFMPASHIFFENNITSAHTQPTDDSVNTESCTVSESPYISDCQYDGAGAGLNQVMLPRMLEPRNNGTLSGSVISWDQVCTQLSALLLFDVRCLMDGLCATHDRLRFVRRTTASRCRLLTPAMRTCLLPAPPALLAL